jgi:hypothetical protein
VRALAFKWIRVAFRCWKDRVVYDESKYLAALARRGSPLAALVATATMGKNLVKSLWILGGHIVAGEQKIQKIP